MTLSIQQAPDKASYFKAAYINEIFKIAKKKKITVLCILSLLAALIGSAIVVGINNVSGIMLAGSGNFAIVVLSVMIYSLIPLFTAFICVDMFGGEFADNTMKFTLTCPASRVTVFIAKLMAAATFIMANLMFVMMISILVSVFFDASLSIHMIVIAYVVSFLPLFMFAMTVSVVSCWVKGTTSAFMLCILLFLGFNFLEVWFPAVKSFFFTSTFGWYNLFMGDYINTGKILRIFLILLGYGVMLFGAGLALFERKDL
jgi:ABC-2 type transport system permease protein